MRIGCKRSLDKITPAPEPRDQQRRPSQGARQKRREQESIEAKSAVPASPILPPHKVYGDKLAGLSPPSKAAEKSLPSSSSKAPNLAKKRSRGVQSEDQFEVRLELSELAREANRKMEEGSDRTPLLSDEEFARQLQEEEYQKARARDESS